MLTTLHTYLDVLTRHTTDLMTEAESWTETAQEHLRQVWTHIDDMLGMMPLPPHELTDHVTRLSHELTQLERFEFSSNEVWHLQVLRHTITYVSQVIDEHGAHRPDVPDTSDLFNASLNSPALFS